MGGKYLPQGAHRWAEAGEATHWEINLLTPHHEAELGVWVSFQFGDAKLLLQWHRAAMHSSLYCQQHLPEAAVTHLASQAREFKHGMGEHIPWLHPFLMGWMQLAGLVTVGFIDS